MSSSSLAPSRVEPLVLAGCTRRRLLVIDNHDSFTYNLVQLLACLGVECTVVLNDAPLPSSAFSRETTGSTRSPRQAAFDGILLSPGPCGPEQSGTSLTALSDTHGIPILGVCLGHQVIAHYFGARVVRVAPVHGKQAQIVHDGSDVFRGVPSPFLATRYHSLAVDPASMPSALEVCATTTDGIVMAFRHRTLPIRGVQFHPESIASNFGDTLLRNWIESLPSRGSTRASDPVTPHPLEDRPPVVG